MKNKIIKKNNNLQGREWFANFLTQNPSLTMRTPQKLGTERALITYQEVEELFRKLYEFLAAEVTDCQAVLQNPQRIFNADESGFPLSAKKKKKKKNAKRSGP